MPEQENQADLLAICDQAVKGGEAVSAVEWTIDYDDGDKRNVLVIVIPEPRRFSEVQSVARTIVYLLESSCYVSPEVLRAALVAPTVNLDLKWEKDTNA